MKKTEEKITFTPYQQSLIDQSSQRSTKQMTRRWVMISLVSLVASAFLAQSYDALPVVLNGWLIFATATYIGFNWLGVGGFLFIWGMFSILKFTMQKPQEEQPPIAVQINGQVQKMEDRNRSAITGFLKASNFFATTGISVIRIADIIADSFLFVMLVTVNHPYMALLHGTSVLLQRVIHRKIEKKLKSVISMLSDPLEETEKTNIDDLMNKLCNPEV